MPKLAPDVADKMCNSLLIYTDTLIDVCVTIAKETNMVDLAMATATKLIQARKYGFHHTDGRVVLTLQYGHFELALGNWTVRPNYSVNADRTEKVHIGFLTKMLDLSGLIMKTAHWTNPAVHELDLLIETYLSDADSLLDNYKKEIENAGQA